MSPKVPEPLSLEPLAPYEDRLLSALAFFRFKRSRPVQARHCLSMYLRQGEGRIMQELRFYARHLGLTAEELLELIYTEPETATERIHATFGDGRDRLLMDAEED
jgi:hypothetical protein